MTRPNVVNKIRTAVHHYMPHADVILFGSEARGDAHEDSDIDLLVLLPQEHITFQEKDAILTPLYDIELATHTLINPLIYSQSYWNNRPMDYFKLNIQNEGIRL